MEKPAAHHWHSAQAIRFVATTHLDLPLSHRQTGRIWRNGACPGTVDPLVNIEKTIEKLKITKEFVDLSIENCDVP